MFSYNVFAGETLNPFTGNYDIVPTIEEEDGSPSVYAVTKIIVSNDSITSVTGETIHLNTGGSGNGGGAPTDATYITQTVNATLTAEQALTSLVDGLLLVNGTTGVLSNATAGIDYIETEVDGSITNEIQNIWQTVATDGSSIATDSPTDTLTIAGGGINTTSQSGDTITVTGTETDPTALLTAGTDNVKDTHINWGTAATQVSAVDVPIADSGSIITGTEVETALQENRTAIDLNTAKETNTDDQTIDVFSISGDNVQLSLESDGEATKTVDISGTTAVAANTAKDTNVSTTLSVGTVGVNTVAITSDGGADDVTLPAATVTTAGMLTTAKWGEIVANNAKDTNVPTALSAGTVNATTYGITSDGGANDIVLPEADTTNAGLLGSDKWDEIVANSVHSADNTQAHSDYLLNSGADTMAGALTINPGTLFIQEQADASADVAGQGQIWVNTATPNELWWTDDAGTDKQLGAGAGDVTSAANITEHSVVRGADEAKGVELSTVFISDAGELTNTSQPCFSVRPSAAQDDIAENSNVTIVFGTEIFDVGSDFASNVYTAPVTGKYQLNAAVVLKNLDTAATYYFIVLQTSNREYACWLDPTKFSGDIGYFTFSVSVLADMDANDTAYVFIYQEGSGVVQTDVDITMGRTYFNGALLF